VQPGDTALVHGGSGGVGIAAIQLARAAGVRVYATAGTPRGLDLVREHGAHMVFDHAAPGYAAAIRDATSGRGIRAGPVARAWGVGFRGSEVQRFRGSGVPAAEPLNL